MPRTQNACASLAEPAWRRIVQDLEAIVDQRIALESLKVEKHDTRPAGRGRIHISFRLNVLTPSESLQGCLLLPLPAAITLAGYLMMVDDEIVAASRESTSLDVTTKEAMMEICRFVASAVDGVVRSNLPEGYAVEADGCQGVRPDVRPRLDYEEGQDLVVARASLRIHEYEPCEAILVLPAF